MTEHEELAALIDQIALAWEPNVCLLGNMTASQLARAATLLRQPAPAPVPVPVAERPWERPGWCDADGRCWWGRCADEVFNPEWALAPHADIKEFCSDAMPQHCLPHWAIPQPPQGGEVEPAPATDTRNPECVAAWPECYDGGYDPSCCRFPKSCSCGGQASPQHYPTHPQGAPDR